MSFKYTLRVLAVLIIAREAAGSFAPDILCSDVSALPPEDDTCQFAKDNCTSSSFINYIQVYFCHVKPAGMLFVLIYVLFTVIVLGVLFRWMSQTADEFFACVLSQISQDMGLPPRLAGVTLLALGNGAPDLSSSIAAVQAGDIRLALGALTGGGMFVGFIVAGRIIISNKGVKARGAQIRDIAFQLVATVLVFSLVLSGKIGYGGVFALLSLYGSYVVIVAIVDFSKRAGVEWPVLGRNISRKISRKLGLVDVRHSRNLLEPVDVVNEQLSDVSSEVEEGVVECAPVAQLGSFNSSNGSTVELTMPIRQTLSVPEIMTTLDPSGGALPARRTTTLPPVVPFNPRSRYDELVHMPAREYRKRALADMAASKSFKYNTSMGSAGNNEVTTYEAPTIHEGEEYNGLVEPASPPSERDADLEMEGDQEDGDEEAENHVSFAQHVASWVDLPLRTVLKATIPLVEPSLYRRHWFVVSMTLSPIFIALCFNRTSILSICMAVVAGLLMGFGAHTATEHLGIGQAPEWDCGCPFPVGAAVIAVYGFAVAALWISKFADEIVGILRFYGIVAGLDSAVLGVTILAWGNSLMDFMNNAVLAGKSRAGSSMAMTACFAGPLFNMLCGLGIGFWTVLNKNQEDRYIFVYRFDAVVILGCLGIIFGTAGLIGAAFYFDHWLSERVGWVMIVWYTAWMTLVSVFVLSGL